MPRSRKETVYNAPDQVIVEYFDQAMGLKDTQKAASRDISALNSLMQQAGVDPGTLSLCCRLARMKEGKRGIAVALLHRYLQVLASKLEDPTVKADRDEVKGGASEPVPFASARGPAAA